MKKFNLKKMLSMSLVFTMLASQSVFAVSQPMTEIKSPAIEISNATESKVSNFAVTEGQPELGNLIVMHNGTYRDRKIIKLENSPNSSAAVAGTAGFISDVTEYELYLLSTDAKAITLDASAMRLGVNDTLKINGYDVERDTVNPDITHKFISTTVAVANNVPVKIELTRGTKTTTYTINVTIAEDVKADPHIFGEFHPYSGGTVMGKDVSTISIYGVNADVYSATVTFDLKQHGTDAEMAFVGFSKKDGTILDDATQELSRDKDVIFEINENFIIETVKSDGQFISVTVASKDGNVPVSIGTDRVKIATIAIKDNDKFIGAAKDMINDISVRPAADNNDSNLQQFGSAAYLGKYFDVRDTISATNEEDKSTLSFIQNPLLHVIYMTINHDSNNKRVVYSVKTDANALVRGTSGYVTDMDVETSILGDGEYKMEVTAKGYKTVLTASELYERPVKEFGTVYRAIELLAGELTDDGVINGDDRAKMISVINQLVVEAGSGFVHNGTDDIYGDYNNDNIINSLDLGRLLKNTNADYSPDIKPIVIPTVKP